MAEMKRNVSVVNTREWWYCLDFDAASVEPVSKIAGVAKVDEYHEYPNRHFITIDTRYDQAEVLAEIIRVVETT